MSEQPTRWGSLFAASNRRTWTIEANDGIIATAGLLEGFAGAGASERTLLFTASIATIVGALAVAGTNWAEAAAEREAQVHLAEQEELDLALEPSEAFDELVGYWMGKGLSADVARQVASELTARDALAAQLEWEYGFAEPMQAELPIMIGLAAGAAYGLGSLIPLLIAMVTPIAIESWAIAGAVVIALALTSLIAARSAQVSARRMLMRSLTVGVATLAISYGAGTIFLP